jgi:HPt (histidine-containing phosphotransfer) domain-containing protein
MGKEHTHGNHHAAIKQMHTDRHQKNTHHNSFAMTATIDFTYLKTVSGGDEAFELHMIESLISEIDQKMAEMQGCISGHDPDGIRLQAHSLKNICGILGAGLLKEQFFLLEKNGGSMAADLLQKQYMQTEEEWRLNKQALGDVITGYKGRLS